VTGDDPEISVTTVIRRKSLFLGEKMDRPAYFEEKRKYPRYSIRLPLEYWQTDDACRGGLVVNLSEGGLLIHSLQDMPVGKELNVGIFFPNGYEFDGIRVTGKIVWKDLHYETDWNGYKYGIEFVRISEEDREKLVNLLRGPSILEEMPMKEDMEPKNPSSEKPVSSPTPSLSSCQMKEISRNCLLDRFKTKILHLW
jgi:hypothetical protein